MNSLAQKTCSICGEGFGCGAKKSVENGGGSCWCEVLPRVEIVEGLDCYCPKCLTRIIQEQKQTSEDTGNSPPQLIEGVDYYLEGNSLVFTALYHLHRGYCCDNGCRHCPYEKRSRSVETTSQK
jgi:uncharacterized protein DUF5522